MRHKCHITLLILLVTLIAMPCKTSAQRYEFEDSEGTYQVEYVSKSHKNNNPFYTWHDDIRFSVGMPGGLSIIALRGLYIGLMDDSAIILNEYFSPATTYIPPITIEYNHYIKDWFVLGAKGNFSGIYKYKYDTTNNKRIGVTGNYLMGAMVNMRFEYLRKQRVQLYSSIALGCGVRLTEKYIYILPMVDWTYLGVSFGREIFGFAEIGGGMPGFARVGIGGRF